MLSYVPSYSVTEELENELALNCTDEEQLTPFGVDMESENRYSIGLAFDNYDKQVETLSGKDTLHDTVGIVYQNLNPVELPVENQVHFDVSEVRKKHKTKQLLADKEIPDDEITPALKKSGIKRRRTYELVDKE